MESDGGNMMSDQSCSVQKREVDEYGNGARDWVEAERTSLDFE
jgi:hypothetical protein